MDVTPKDAQGRLVGKRQQKWAQGFQSKGAALSALNQLQVEKAAGTYVDPSRLTFGDYLDHWYANADTHGWEGSTKAEYDVSIRLHVKPYAIAATPIQALTSAQFRTHYQRLLREGKVRRNKAGEVTDRDPLSRKTVQNIHIMVRAALNDAVAADPPLLRKNVAVGAYTYSRRKDRPEMLTWSDEEVWTFLDFTTDDLDHAMWRTALMTGMRRGELLGLHRRDMVLDRVINGRRAPALTVRQQYARNGAEGLVFKGLKTGDRAWRTIDLDEGTAEVLRAQLEAQEFQRRSWGPAYAGKCPRCGKQIEERCPTCGLKAIDLDLVFCHPDGSPFDPDVVSRRFERRAQMCPGVIRIRFHDVRHSHATLLLEDGATERYVVERLGDTVEMVHETYGHVTPKMRVAAVERLAQRLRRPQVTETSTARERSVSERDSAGGGEGPET